jgi:uncharacterized protein (TIGR02118 family)
MGDPPRRGDDARRVVQTMTGPREDLVTRVGLVPRAEGLTVEEAQEHWRGPHGDVAREIPGIRSYVQNHATYLDGAPLLPYPGFDICAELEFDSFEVMREGFASEHYQTAVRADENHLIDKRRFMLALTRRRVLFDDGVPEDAVKLMTFLRVHRGVATEELIETLTGPYGEAVRRAGPVRHDLLVTDAEAHDSTMPPPCCEAIDVLWFGSPGDAVEALTGALSDRAGWLLAGLAFGTARLLARPIRQV